MKGTEETARRPPLGAWKRPGRGRRRRLAGTSRFALATTLVAVLLASPCASAEPSFADKAAAQSLFREGRTLLTSGKTEAACSKFADSDRLDPAIGTHLNLALCHESMGRTATAWVEFGEVADQAERLNDRERAGFARKHVERLDARLSRVRLRVAQPAAAVTLRIDGREVGQAAWTTAVPLDPGRHTIEVTSAGKATWSMAIDVPPGPSTQEITVPPLVDTSSASAVPSAMNPPSPRAAEIATHGQAGPRSSETAEPAAPGGTKRTYGYVLGAVGVGGLAVGSIFGLMAFSQNATANEDCHLAGGKCTSAGVTAGQNAQTDALVSTIAFGVGAGALVAAVYLVVTSHAQPARAGDLHVEPLIGKLGQGLQLGGAW